MTTPMKNGWVPRKLNDLGFVGRGKSRHRPRNAPELYGGPYPFVQTAEIMASEFYITSHAKTYSEAGLAQSKMWQPHTLCMTIAGENTAETALLSYPACFPDSVVGFIADPALSDVRFVKYYLDYIKKRIRQVTRGATQDNLSLDKLLSFDIVAPPVAQQRKISSILATYDELILNNTRRIAILEAMAQAIYREWFVDFRFPGHEKVKFVDSPLGMIPEGWEATEVGELCVSVRAGGTPRRNQESYWNNGTVDWYKTKELQDGFLLSSEEQITELAANESTTRLFGPRTLLMAIYGSPTVGRMGILTKRSACNQAALAMVPDIENVSLVFLYQVLMSLRDHFNNIAMGAAQQNISKDKVVHAQCILPEQRLLSMYNSLAEPAFDLIENLSKRNASLRQTRDLLLPKLISGQLDVEDLDIETGETLTMTE